MVFRECRLREVCLLDFNKNRTTFTVRAFLSDNAEVSYPLEEAVRRPSSVSISLLQDVVTLFNHRGGQRAVFFDLVRGSDGKLAHILVGVSARRPDLALTYGRAEINRLLDRFSADAQHSHPFSIQRLELLSPIDGEVIAYQIMIPFSGLTRIGQISGFRPAGLFAGHHAMFREAINNPSPFYRVLLAFRAYEGIRSLRERIAKARERYNITERLPKATRLDKAEIARLRFVEEVQKLDNIDQLFGHFDYLRHGIAHFLLRPTEAAQGHIYLSSSLANTYAMVSALLLKYVRIESRQLEAYYARLVRPHIDRGTLIWPSVEQRDRFVAFAPDDESDVHVEEV